MFGFIMSFFDGEINGKYALKNANNPEWFDLHWDQLMEYYDNNSGFYALIHCILFNPSIEMLEVCKKNKYPFEGIINSIFYYRYNIEIFKWIIQNNLISKGESSQLYYSILIHFKEDCFERFQIMFEEGYIFDPKNRWIPFYKRETIEKFYEYGKIHNINFIFEINRYTDLKEYLEWMKYHEIRESTLSFRFLGYFYKLEGIKLFEEYGYLFPCEFYSGWFDKKTEEYLISKGFEIKPFEDKKLI